MKKVGVDGNEANILKRVGSNIYAFELLWAMHRYLEKNPEFCVRVYLSREVVHDMPPATAWWEYRVIGPAKLWTQWRLPIDLYLRNDLSLFFSPGHYTPRFSPVPVIASIMDLAFLYYPEQFRTEDTWKLTNLTRRSVERSIRLVAISENTKSDIVKEYGYPAKDIAVAYPAVAHVSRISQPEALKEVQGLGISKPFFAFVGTLQPRKNIVRVIQAFEMLKQQGKDIQLVLAGKIGWRGDEIQMAIAHSAFAQDIIQTGYISEEQKLAVIQSAEATLLVGLYEGFGIPPLESILLGTLPIVSNTSSLPEVVGPDGIFADPLSSNSIAQSMSSVLAMKSSEKEKKLKQLQAHVRMFDWNESGHTVCRLISSVL